jgi:hypothetical protein
MAYSASSGATGTSRSFADIRLLLGAALLSAISACSAGDAMTPNRLGPLMYLDQSKQLSFERKDTPRGEYGTVDLVNDGAITISLSYLKGWAYKGKTAPRGGAEIATGVDGQYGFCLAGLNGAMNGDERLMRIAVPYIDHFLASLLHPDSPAMTQANLSEVGTFLTTVIAKKDGAVTGEWLGQPTTYYVYGKWLWKVDAADNYVSTCAYPLI